MKRSLFINVGVFIKATKTFSLALWTHLSNELAIPSIGLDVFLCVLRLTLHLVLRVISKTLLYPGFGGAHL